MATLLHRIEMDLGAISAASTFPMIQEMTGALFALHWRVRQETRSFNLQPTKELLSELLPSSVAYSPAMLILPESPGEPTAERTVNPSDLALPREGCLHCCNLRAQPRK